VTRLLDRYLSLLKTFPRKLFLFSCFSLPGVIVLVLAGVDEVEALFDAAAVLVDAVAGAGAVAVSLVATLWESPLERGVEGLALNLGDFKLKGGRLPAAIGTSEAARAPRRATMDLTEVSELLEGVGVAKGNENQAVVDEGGHDAKVGALLTTTCASRRDEGTHEFACEGTGLPELSGGIPEGLELSWPGAITSADTDEEAVILREIGCGDNGVVGLGGCVHLRENLLGKSLRDLVDGSRASCGLDAAPDGFGELCDVAVHRVDNNCDPRSRHAWRLL